MHWQRLKIFNWIIQSVSDSRRGLGALPYIDTYGSKCLNNYRLTIKGVWSAPLTQPLNRYRDCLCSEERIFQNPET
ncbi:hypothetical protein J6590_090451 [Homalodisca vitripennis]|nr:hypothetical protein J6590_090451 [Homalodisca vitripennis]